MAHLEGVIAGLVYASVLLGVLFLYALSGIKGIPSFLFPSILAGELLWVLCAFAIYRRARWARYMAVVLAVVTLGVSLPQPTHYDFAESGQIAAFLIFTGGSVLQFLLIGAVALFAYRERRS